MAAGSDRFWLRELRVSQHFSIFYGPSVQAMATQLNALPTDPGGAHQLVLPYIRESVNTAYPRRLKTMT